jgi:hypothetical protein
MPSLASLLTLTYSLRFYSPVLPPADSLAVSRTAQSPVPSAQLLARIPCPGCADAAQKGGTEDLENVGDEVALNVSQPPNQTSQ